MNSYQIIDFTSGVPDISIAMLAYNHEKFIVQAIEGVLMQKTSYKYKMVIAEDKSPDSTREMLLDYQKKYPDKIKLILQNKNVGSKNNNIDLLSNLEGKYIAALECDDYWTDPLKLQKQIGFLENNKDYSMVCHNANIIYEGTDKQSIRFNQRNVEGDININEILSQWDIPTASMLFRIECVKPLPKWFGEIYSGDFTISLLCVHKGKIKFSPEIMSIYRVNYKGTSATATIGKNMTFVLDEHTKLLNFFNVETNLKYANLIRERLALIAKEKEFIIARNKGLFFAFFKMPNLFLQKFSSKILRYFKQN